MLSQKGVRFFGKNDDVPLYFPIILISKNIESAKTFDIAALLWYNIYRKNKSTETPYENA
jgi:hypothetical protein